MPAVEASLFDFRPPCPKCGYSTGSLDTAPPFCDLPTSLLSSYYLPSPTERSTIEARISSGEDYIYSPETELSNLQKVTQHIEARLSYICACKEHQSSLLAPIRKLPDELLSVVFDYVCGGYVEVCQDFSPPNFWILQQVCVRWRKVVRGTPSLWSSFEIEDEITGLNCGTVEQRVKWCLEFSGRSPLSISFQSTYAPVSRWFLRAVEDVTRHADRWATFKADTDIFIRVVKETSIKNIICQKDFPQLRTLVFTGNYHLSKDSIPSHVFQHATALEQVKLYHVKILDPSNFPWAGVSRLELQGCRLYLGEADIGEVTITSVLCSMPLLQELILDGAFVYASPNYQHQTITLPLLHTLSNCSSGEDDLIWPELCVPRLTDLELAGGVAAPHLIVSMSQNSGSVVKRLQLRSCSPSFALQVLKGLRNVEELSLVEISGCHELLMKLTWDPMSDGENLLPSLRSMELRLLHSRYLPASTSGSISYVPLLMDIMRSRSASITTDEGQTSPTLSLQKVSYKAEPSTAECGAMTHMKALGEQSGIKVEIELEQ